MTNKQKQCLLFFLGYYAGEIDGVFGGKSRQATKDFQTDYGLAADGIFGPKTEEAARNAVAGLIKPVNLWDTVKHFKRQEFACKCGNYCNGFPVEPEPKLVRLCDRVRDYFNAPMVISSGVRCAKHNDAVGGVANSRHLKGKAVDFRIVGKNALDVLDYVLDLPEVRYAYAIDAYYVHMDIE